MVVNDTNRIQYIAGGVSADFTVPYPFYDRTHLEVYADGLIQVIDVDYSVQPIVNSPAGAVGGTVTFTVIPVVDTLILIVRVIPATQLIDLKDLSTFPADEVEKGLDLAVMRIQQNEDDEAKSLHIPFTNISTSTLLADPALTTSWNKAIVVSGDGLSFNLLEISVTDFAQPLTTKGDLVTHNGTNHLRFPLGAAEEVLSVANPPGTTGLIWRALNTFTIFQNLESAVQDLDKTIVNPVINGNMEVWQRGTSFTATANNQYTADRWMWSFAGAGVVNITQSADVPATPNPSNMLFNFSLNVDISTADAALAAGDAYLFVQKVEGHNWRHFAQRPMMLKFFVRASKTGLHAVSFRNSGADRSYVAEYTVNVADTWEEKSVFVSASPSAGTWDTQTGVGLQIGFTLAAGSTFHTTPKLWQTGNFVATSATVNEMDNAANFFRVTGVQLYLSNSQIDHPQKYRTFNEELELCKRYYQKSFNYDIAPVSNAGVNTGEINYAQIGGLSSVVRGLQVEYKPELRASPTFVIYNPEAAGNETRNRTLAANDTGSAVNQSSAKRTFIQSTSSGSAATNHIHSFHFTADAEL